MSVDSQFSSLPKELKLKIFGYLDFLTIRRVCHFVNQEFQQLSTDFTLFQEYEQSKYDNRAGTKAAAELQDDLFLNHLKVLTVTPACLEKIAHLKFASLERLILKCDPKDQRINGFHSNPRSLKAVELYGIVRVNAFDQPFAQLLTAVDTLLIEKRNDLELIKSIPAKNVLLDTSGKCLSFDIIQEAFPHDKISEKGNNFQIKIGAYYFPKVYNESSILDPKFGDLVSRYLVKVSWFMNDKSQWQAIVKICELCSSLEELMLGMSPRNKDAPAIGSLATANLQKLFILYAFGSTGKAAKLKVLDDCSILINNVQASLTLYSLCLDRFSPTMLRTKSLSLSHCSFKSELYLQLPDCVEDLEISDCELLTKFSGSRRATKLKSLKLDDCSFETIKGTLLPLQAQRLKIEYVHDCEEILYKLTHMNFEGFATIEFSVKLEEHIESVLERFSSCLPQVSVLDFQTYDEVIDEQTFEILTGFTQLKYFVAETYSDDHVTEQFIQNLFPSGIVSVSDDGLCKYEIFL